MSCSSSNSPIDISSSKSSGKCDLKCDYKFRYQTSSCIGKNMGDYISLSYDNTSSSYVTFNLISYFVKEVRIYHRSLHSFNGNKLDAEMVIIHNSNTGEMPLLVCIPVRILNSTSISAEFFRNVVTTMSKNSPAEGDTTTIKINNYNLNFFVPKKPFYSYTGTEPYQPCSEKVNYIVYDASEVYLDIPQNVYDNLKKIIKENYYNVKTGVSFFYNSKGPNTATSDDIYIDCQPVGQSEETINVIENTSNTYSNDYSFENLKNNDLFKFIIGIIIFLIIIYVLYSITSIIKLISKGVNETSKMLNVSG
jgi:carbonic anhydrase